MCRSLHGIMPYRIGEFESRLQHQHFPADIFCPDIVSGIKTIRMGWAGHVLRLAELEVHKKFWYIFIPWDVVRLNLLGLAATNWTTVPSQDDIWVRNILWNENLPGEVKYSEKTYQSATLSTRDPIWPNLGSKPGHRSVKPVANRLSYDTLQFWSS
jgi:hypothetical protein